VRDHLAAGARGERPETPKPDDATFARVRHTLIASNATAVSAARDAAAGLGWSVVAARMSGDARLAARALLALADEPGDGPLCVVAGGETVVTVTGSGSGGRCQELALAAALAIDRRDDVALLAAGTDGVDGPTDAAGAYADGGTVARGRHAGADAAAALADNDAHGFFCREGGVFRTGTTGTNVADLALVLRDRSR
jgi:glycerate-2-kinase